MGRLFNGSNAKISYGHVAGFDNRGNLTISFWYKPVSPATGFYPRIITQETTDAGNGFAITMGESNPLNQTNSFRNGNPAQSACDSGSPFTENAWQHVYVRWDGSEGFANEFFDDRIKIWKNGTQVCPPGFYGANNMPAAMGTTTRPFELGEGGGAPGQYWHGELAEIGIWLDNDVTRIANLAAGQAPSFFQTNLHVYIPLLQAGGVEDVKGNASGGTNINTTTVAHPPGITYPSGPPPVTGRKFFFWQPGELTDAEWFATGNDTPGGSITRV